jgi:superfamily II DNA or RNA helicase
MATGVPLVRSGDVVRMRGERWRVVRYVGYTGAAVIEAAGCGAANRAVRARFLLPCEPVDRLPATSTPRLVRPGTWRHAARHALATACPSWGSLRAAREAVLDIIPFQLEPALALVRGAGCRYLLADAVGLGKTIQAGLMIAETLARRHDARALVIAPAGLRDQWCDELRRRFGLEPAIFDAAGVARLAAQLPTDVNPWAAQSIAIASIDYVKRPETVRALEALMWDVMVFDEAHNLTGHSDRAAAAALLADRARALVLLTATPHSGDDAAFARLCSLGNPRGVEPLVVFRRTRADATVAGSRRAPLLRVRPTPAETAMHAALMEYVRLVWTEAAGGARLVASVLARRGCSSAASLAHSVERRLALLDDGCPHDPVQATLPYADSDDAEPEMVLGLPGLQDSVDERARLEALLHLARAAAPNESKIVALRRLLSKTDEPAIVFTEYRDTLLRLAAELADIPTADLHGGQTSRERADALRRFATGGARLLLATDAGSEGLNLHHRCRLVVNLELPWTPLRLEQRAGRVDRIGQARRVHVVHLVAAGTCEEATLARLVRRLHRSRGTLSAFEPVPGERQVAESVVADRHLIPNLETAPPPSGTLTIDLRDDAEAEAAWIRQARVLASNSSSVATLDRPIMTHVRRRSRRTMPTRGVWLFRLAFVSSSGHLIWESLVPLAADLARLPGRRRAVWRALLDPSHPAVAELLEHTCHERRVALRAAVDEALHRWRDREHTLTEAICARHARLSAGLMQRGLFDRRSDRLAAAQAALIERALAQSQDRLADLAACERLRLDGCDLVFAIVLD